MYEYVTHKINKINKNIIFVYSSRQSQFNIPAFTTIKPPVKNNAYLIVDEAHSCGVFGSDGKGIVSDLKLEKKVFARIVTFGKAYGVLGACVLGQNELIDFLINFSRSFIYTTALPPSAYADISDGVGSAHVEENRLKLENVISYFRKSIGKANTISDEKSPIQLIRIGNVKQTHDLANQLQESRLAVKPIFSPTVPVGNEGLRICLHSFNTTEQVDFLVQIISQKR